MSDTGSRHWFVLALILVLGWLLYRLAPVITPFAVSAGIAYRGDPLVDRLEAEGIEFDDRGALALDHYRWWPER